MIVIFHNVITPWL